MASGDLDNIQRGDVVIIKEATAIGPASETATTKAGTTSCIATSPGFLC